MSKLRPISPRPLPRQKPAEQSLTDSHSGARLRLSPLRPTWTQESPRPLSRRFRTSSPKARRTLDFDIETVAAGFGDPEWVPQKVTALAWSWCDEEEVHVRTRLDGHEQMLDGFLEVYDEAAVVTGHNLLRFDLPILNAELLRSGYPPLGAKLVQDTMRIVRTKGFKKGQDNILTLLDAPVQKLAMNWQEWQDAYEEPGWETVIERVRSDVQGHKLMRREMIARGWLKPAVMWRP